MHVATTPITFTTGDVLDAQDLNDLYLYAADAIDDVASKRWQDSVLTYQCVEDVATPYTGSSSTEELTWRFTCPTTCVCKGAYFSANLSSSAEVKVTLTTAAGAGVTGASAPLLTTGGAVSSASTDTTLACSDRFVLAAGVEYKLVLSSSSTFNILRGDLTLLVATDRWNGSGTQAPPLFAPTLLRASDAPDATVVAANNTALSTQAALFASGLVAPTPLLFVKHNLTSTSNANPRTFTIPRFLSSRAQSKITRIYLYAAMDGTGGTTCTATLKDQSGATLTTVTANVAGVTRASADSGALNINLTSATPTVTTSSALDYSLVLANASSTNARKLYALVWISRA